MKFSLDEKYESSFISSNASKPNSSLFIKASSNSSKLSLSAPSFISSSLSSKLMTINFK